MTTSEMIVAAANPVAARARTNPANMSVFRAARSSGPAGAHAGPATQEFMRQPQITGSVRSEQEAPVQAPSIPTMPQRTPGIFTTGMPGATRRLAVAAVV